MWAMRPTMREKTWTIWGMRATRPEAKSKRPSRAPSPPLSALRQSRPVLICSRSWARRPSKQPEPLRMWAGSLRPTSQAPTPGRRRAWRRIPAESSRPPLLEPMQQNGQRTTPTPSTGAAMRSSLSWCPIRPYTGKWASPGTRPQSCPRPPRPLPMTSATPLPWTIPRP